MKNFVIVIKADSGNSIHINSITIKADCLIQSYDIACSFLQCFSDDYDYTIVEIREI